ncbi:MAG: Vitamin import ATP-binding protein BtuD [Bacteroidota bacterium]|jgi:ABC-type sulfate/molybdate transport systems ATPase subunit
MLDVREIQFSYLDQPTVHPISFQLKAGKTLAIIGESGCGKSTLLKLIYGLYDLDQGQIFWNENEVLGPKYHLIPGMEYMKFLAQDFDLMPFITVAENVGKYLSNIYPEVKQARIMELLDTVEMTEFAHTKAKYLSGGQMQRVALARVLALEPQVLLLDEPFSHIDNFRKNSLRRKLFRYLKSKKITTLIATHDSTDVLSFADTVLVMRDGSLVAEGTPTELFASENPYVASLFGDISMYSEKGTVHHAFPHQLQIASEGIPAVVVQSYFRGSHYLLELQADTTFVLVEHAAAIPEGTSVFFNKKP